MNSRQNGEACPKCDDKFLNKNDVINHMLLKHVQGDAGTSQEVPVAGASHEVPVAGGATRDVPSNQSILQKCLICGILFYNVQKLKHHQLAAHQPSNDVIEILQVELTEIELFDEEKTKKTVESGKVKPFQKLTKIPTKRNRFWRAAYNLALEKLTETE